MNGWDGFQLRSLEISRQAMLNHFDESQMNFNKTSKISRYLFFIFLSGFFKDGSGWYSHLLFLIPQNLIVSR